MTKLNPKNERIKRHYFEYLKQADGKADATIRQIEKAISRYEGQFAFAGFVPFSADNAIDFKKALLKTNLAKSTILQTINALKKFFGWLSCQPGYKSKIQSTDIAYFSLSEKDTRAAQAPSYKTFPTLEQVKHVLSTMPAATDIEKRDRALVALVALTAIRDGALVSLKLKHIDVARKLVVQNPNEVKTKGSKRIDSFFAPIGEEIEQVFLDWITFLKTELLFGNDDPVFPKTALIQDENDCFIAGGLSRDHWSNASPIRAIFKRAFLAAELPYFSPHRFRDMFVQLAYQRCTTPAEFKAWSQNLGHESPLTTFTSYGTLSLEEQSRLIRNSTGAANDNELEVAKKIVKMMREEKSK